MKIKVTYKPYEEVVNMPRAPHRKPKFQGVLWRKLIEALAVKELKETELFPEGSGRHERCEGKAGSGRIV